MKKLFIIFMLFSLCLFSAYKTPTPTVTALVSSAQDLTTTWRVLGGQTNELTTGSYDKIGTFFDIDINDSNDVRVRLTGAYTTGGNTFLLPIKTVGTSDVKIEDEYLEFNEDSDQRVFISWDIDRLIPFIYVEAQVSATGTTAAQIDDARYVLRWE